MRYMLLIYTNPANWEVLSQAERDGLMAEYGTFTQEIIESGEHLGGAPLTDPSTARTVRVRNGHAEATDGPYIESKEFLAGYYLVECETLARAEELAAKIPDAKFNAVEVRSVMAMGGPDL
jgi:hypothetical protein